MPKAKSEMAEAGSQRDADDSVDRLITEATSLYMEGDANEYAWVCVYSVLYSISSEFTSQELCGSDCHQLP